MVAMFLYYSLLIDLVVFSNRVSAFVLVCGRMLGEVGLFLLALFGGDGVDGAVDVNGADGDGDDG